MIFNNLIDILYMALDKYVKFITIFRTLFKPVWSTLDQVLFMIEKGTLISLVAFET